MPVKLLWLWLGGGLGTIGRYFLAAGLNQWPGFSFPFGTLTVNVLGCFLIGVLDVIFTKTVVDPNIRLFLMTGVLGGFTTFSAFGLDAAYLVKHGAAAVALGYVAASVILGLLAVGVGIWLTKTLIVWGTSA